MTASVHHLNSEYKILYFCIVIILYNLYFLGLFHIILSLYLNFGCMEYIIICIYVSICILFTCQFTLVALDWLWCNDGADFGTVAPHMDSLHLEQVERPPWGARLHPWTKQQISQFPLPSIPQGGMECQHTHSSLSDCVCQLDRLYHAGIGRSLCLNTCNIQTVACKFNSKVDTLTVQCLKQPAKV